MVPSNQADVLNFRKWDPLGVKAYWQAKLMFGGIVLWKEQGDLVMTGRRQMVIQRCCEKKVSRTLGAREKPGRLVFGTVSQVRKSLGYTC